MAALPVLVRDDSAARLESELIPRSEYPQPQFQRAEWMNLNGIWEFEFDDENAGAGRTLGRRKAASFTVPFWFRSVLRVPLSGIGDHHFHPYSWYRRQFEIPGRLGRPPGAATLRRRRLQVDGLGERATGRRARGRTHAIPLRYHPPAYKDTNSVTVRVEDPPSDRYLPRGKQHWEETSASIFYTRTTGIWQTVWLEPVGDSYLERVSVDAADRRHGDFRRHRSPAREDLQLFATVRHRDTVVAMGMAQVLGRESNCSRGCSRPATCGRRNRRTCTTYVRTARGDEVLDRVRVLLRIPDRFGPGRPGDAERRARVPEDGAGPGLLAGEHAHAAVRRGHPGRHPH